MTASPFVVAAPSHHHRAPDPGGLNSKAFTIIARQEPGGAAPVHLPSPNNDVGMTTSSFADQASPVSAPSRGAPPPTPVHKHQQQQHQHAIEAPILAALLGQTRGVVGDGSNGSVTKRPSRQSFPSRSSRHPAAVGTTVASLSPRHKKRFDNNIITHKELDEYEGPASPHAPLKMSHTENTAFSSLSSYSSQSIVDRRVRNARAMYQADHLVLSENPTLDLVSSSSQQQDTATVLTMESTDPPVGKNHRGREPLRSPERSRSSTKKSPKKRSPIRGRSLSSATAGEETQRPRSSTKKNPKKSSPLREGSFSSATAGEETQTSQETLPHSNLQEQQQQQRLQQTTSSKQDTPLPTTPNKRHRTPERLRGLFGPRDQQQETTTAAAEPAKSEPVSRRSRSRSRGRNGRSVEGPTSVTTSTTPRSVQEDQPHHGMNTERTTQLNNQRKGFFRKLFGRKNRQQDGNSHVSVSTDRSHASTQRLAAAEEQTVASSLEERTMLRSNETGLSNNENDHARLSPAEPQSLLLAPTLSAESDDDLLLSMSTRRASRGRRGTPRATDHHHNNPDVGEIFAPSADDVSTLTGPTVTSHRGRRSHGVNAANTTATTARREPSAARGGEPVGVGAWEDPLGQYFDFGGTTPVGEKETQQETTVWPVDVERAEDSAPFSIKENSVEPDVGSIGTASRSLRIQTSERSVMEPPMSVHSVVSHDPDGMSPQSGIKKQDQEHLLLTDHSAMQRRVSMQDPSPRGYHSTPDIVPSLTHDPVGESPMHGDVEKKGAASFGVAPDPPLIERSTSEDTNLLGDDEDSSLMFLSSESSSAEPSSVEDRSTLQQQGTQPQPEQQEQEQQPEKMKVAVVDTALMAAVLNAPPPPPPPLPKSKPPTPLSRSRYSEIYAGQAPPPPPPPPPPQPVSLTNGPPPPPPATQPRASSPLKASTADVQTTVSHHLSSPHQPATKPQATSPLKASTSDVETTVSHHLSSPLRVKAELQPTTKVEKTEKKDTIESSVWEQPDRMPHRLPPRVAPSPTSSIYDADTGEKILPSNGLFASQSSDISEASAESQPPALHKLRPVVAASETPNIVEKTEAYTKEDEVMQFKDKNDASARKKLLITSMARMNAKTVALLHSINGEPSPRQAWHKPTTTEAVRSPRDFEVRHSLSSVSTSSLDGPPNLQLTLSSESSDSSEDGDAVMKLFQAYSDKFKHRKLTVRVPSPRSGQDKVPSPQASPTASVLKLNEKMNRNIDVHTETVAMGFAAFRLQREVDIACGLATRVVPVPKAKVQKPHYFVAKTEEEMEPKDPIQRAGRRLLSKAAVPIQASARRFFAQREAVDRMWALIEIQSFMRRWRAEANLLASRLLAMTIQRAFRGHIVRKHIKAKHAAATEIQKMIRGYLAAAWAFDTVYSIILTQAQARGYFVRQKLAQETAAATAIQKIFRGYTERLLLAGLGQAASMVQSIWRSYNARQRLQFALVDIIIVQSVARSCIARREVENRRQKLKNAAAVSIQATWRGFQGYTDYILCMVDILVVQRTVRQFLAKMQVSRLRSERAAQRIQSNWRMKAAQGQFRLERAACTIQAEYRRHRAQIRMLFNLVRIILVQSVVRKHMAKFRVRDRRQEIFASNAATKIQATWRGFWKYSHYVIMQYEIGIIQAAVRGYLTRRSKQLELGCCIMIQAVMRQHLATKQYKVLKTTKEALEANLILMRQVNAAKQIQFWWRVVVDCRKEKHAALVIERFFIMVKEEVEREIERHTKKKKKQEKRERRRKQKLAKEQDNMLEKVWLNTVDENHVDVFAFGSVDRTLTSTSKEFSSDDVGTSMSFSSPTSRNGKKTPPRTFPTLSRVPKAKTGTKSPPSSAERKEKLGTLSPTMNLVMQNDQDQDVLDKIARVDSLAFSLSGSMDSPASSVPSSPLHGGRGGRGVGTPSPARKMARSAVLVSTPSPLRKTARSHEQIAEKVDALLDFSPTFDESKVRSRSSSKLDKSSSSSMLSSSSKYLRRLTGGHDGEKEESSSLRNEAFLPTGQNNKTKDEKTERPSNKYMTLYGIQPAAASSSSNRSKSAARTRSDSHFFADGMTSPTYRSSSSLRRKSSSSSSSSKAATLSNVVVGVSSPSFATTTPSYAERVRSKYKSHHPHQRYHDDDDDDDDNEEAEVTEEYGMI